MTAAAACVAGMRCVLVLTATSDAPAIAGNLLLDKLYGATIRLVPSIDPMFAVGQDEAVVAEVAAGERAAGRVPYVIPVGGSSGVGVCGYIGGTRGARRSTAPMRRSRRRGCITPAARAAPRRA